MRIVDVAVDCGSIEISYSLTDDSVGTDVFKMKSQEQAMPSFHQAMQGLKTDFCDICEIGDAAVDRTMIRKVTFNENGPERVIGVTITAEIGLDKSKGTIKVKTPRKYEKGWNDETNTPRCIMSDTLRVGLQRMIEEAKLYVMGNRLQTNLFANVGFQVVSK